METFTLQRVYLPTRVLGSIYSPSGELICKTLELPWLNNDRSVSCIPEGSYRVIYQQPKEGRPYEYFRLPTVPKRSGILIHRGTDVDDSKGCILCASRFINIETDKPTLQESGKKLQFMIDTMPREWMLKIIKKP